jgi:tetratricopeptide (TPR) repeat protein
LEEALVQIRLAAELDPMSPVIQSDIAYAVWNTGRAEEALTLVQRNIERTPELPNNYNLMATFLQRLGQVGKAQRWLQEARRRNPGDSGTWRMGECWGFVDLDDVESAENCARQLGDAFPDKSISLSVWMGIRWYRGEWDEVIAIVESLMERAPGVRDLNRLLADVIAGQGDIKRARNLMADAYPEMLEDALQLSTTASGELNAVLVFAAILNANGEIGQRDVLLLAMEERITGMHRIRGISYGILDVYIHAMRGDRDRAIAALREAIDMGWRASDGVTWFVWWLLPQDWMLESLHQDSEFIVMMNELEADIAAQRQWYEENKDKPLF